MIRHINKISDGLKPCPFCGGKVFIGCDGLTMVVCEDCSMTISNSERSIIKLKDKWNNRVSND